MPQFRLGNKSITLDAARLIALIAEHGQEVMCYVHPLATGFQIVAGTVTRTLIHSTAFQLDSGGNNRGTAAVDEQSTRAGATLVASGDYSVISGGRNNAASEDDSVVGGGTSNIAAGPQGTIGGGDGNQIRGTNASNSIADHATIGGGGLNDAEEDYATIGGGYNNTNYGQYATIGGGNSNEINSGGTANQGQRSTIAGGYNNTIYDSGDYGFIGGGDSNFISGDQDTIVGGETNAIGDGTGTHPNYGFIGGGGDNLIEKNADYNTIGGGDSNQIGDGTAAIDYATIPGGAYGYADKYGQEAYASGSFAATGDAQRSHFVVRRAVTHSDASWYELFLNGSSARVTIAADTVWTFDILLVGTTQGCTKSFGFQINGVIENDGGTTSLLASNVTTIYDTDDVSFDARVTADDGNDALLVEVQDSDGAGDTVRWVANVETAEVTFPA